MPKGYVLIDFENVQPKNLALLTDHPFQVLVFIGTNQVRLPRALVVALHELGADRARYIEIEGSGPNALDFHIAYYVGELAAADSGATFNVISKDRGFDPLIRHLKGRNIRVRRFKDVAEIPELRVPQDAGKDEHIKAIVDNLRGRGQSRPRKVRTLMNTIGNLISGLDENAVKQLVEDLKRRKLISVDNERVSYQLNRKKRRS